MPFDDVVIGRYPSRQLVQIRGLDQEDPVALGSQNPTPSSESALLSNLSSSLDLDRDRRLGCLPMLVRSTPKQTLVIVDEIAHSLSPG